MTSTNSVPWLAYLSEAIGTGLLVLVGVSFVILDFGAGSPIVRLMPDAMLRRVITGFLFGATGAAIAYSPVGTWSGAHINPVVTLAFWIRGKLSSGHSAVYVVAQFAGALAGAIPLLLWGSIGRSVDFGGTTPGAAYTIWMALAGEIVTTAGLIVGLFTFLGHAKLRAYTPLLFPVLYAILVGIEAPLSGTSTNPARSFGPALIAGAWPGWWIYLVGPVVGTLVGLAIHRVGWFRRLELGVAKVYHFEHDHYGIFGVDGAPPRPSTTGDRASPPA
ncbi:MAG: MIP/aquaporin family protein [Gemmatimonadaceae bacterium]